jgi:hypothetical protein
VTTTKKMYEGRVTAFVVFLGSGAGAGSLGASASAEAEESVVSAVVEGNVPDVWAFAVDASEEDSEVSAGFGDAPSDGGGLAAGESGSWSAIERFSLRHQKAQGKADRAPASGVPMGPHTNVGEYVTNV